jgi:hypothetical protein
MESTEKTCGDCKFYVDTNWCRKLKIIVYYNTGACSDFKPRKRRKIKLI